jgi:hypothetical protein
VITTAEAVPKTVRGERQVNPSIFICIPISSKAIAMELWVAVPSSRRFDWFDYASVKAAQRNKHS